MNERREKIHKMIDGITKQGTLEYLERFIFLFLQKWG